ncbi:MAG: sulfur carrier protein ThiS [Lachnospiraceae bacterium]
MIKINGAAVPADGKTLAQYLETTDYNPKRIAVECNGEIVPKAQYGTKVLTDGDVIEVVSFVGGG